MDKLDTKSTGILVIDMQNGFCHDRGALAQAGVDMSRQKAIIPRVRQLVQLGRRGGFPVFLSKQEHYREDAARSRHRIPTHLEKRNIFPCLKGTWDEEIVEDLKAELKPEDEIFIKHRSSCFFDTTLETKLRMRGVQTLIIAGVATNYCVESTIRDAYARDYDLYVVEDCVAGSFPDLHDATLKNVRIYYGQVVSLDELNKMLPEPM